jgi:hypothetical protein
MFCADVIRSKEAQEWRRVRGGLDSGAASGLFALHDADDSGDDHTGFLRGLDGGDGGSAGGANVVDDDNASAFTAEALDAAARAVSLLGLAHEEAMEQRRVRMRLRAPGAGRGHIRHDGISAHGQPTDGFGVDFVRLKQLKNGVAGEPAAFGVQCCCAAVNVVVAGAAGGELELAKPEAGAGEEREELLGVGWVEHRNHSKLAASHILSKWRKPLVPINASEKMMKL